MSLTEVPTAVLLDDDTVPYVEMGGGNKLKVVRVSEREGLWVVANVFQAGYSPPRHRHTGPVHAFTVSGAWRYKEYPDAVNRAGGAL